MKAAGALVLALALAACGKSATAPETAFVDVKRGDLVVGVAVEGELEAIDSVEIKPPPVDIWDFKVSMLAPEGADVKEGQPIVGFDASEMERDLESKMNDIAAAQKSLEKKQNDARLARRTEELAIAEAEAALRKAELKVTGPEDLVSTIQRKKLQLDLDSAKIALEQAKTKSARQKRADDQDINALVETLAQAKDRAKRIQEQLPKMTVKAPRAGTLVYMMHGDEKIKVGDQTWKLGQVVQVVSLSKMRGAGRVDEVDLAKVAIGQVVTVHLDALPDVELAGKITDIAKSLQPKSQTDPSKVIGVKIALAQTAAPLRPGMRFRGEVETERRANVVQVPLEAVFATPDGPVAYKDVGGGKVEPAKLALGKRSATMVEVTRGLAAGDRVSRIEVK